MKNKNNQTIIPENQDKNENKKSFWKFLTKHYKSLIILLLSIAITGLHFWEEYRIENLQKEHKNYQDSLIVKADNAYKNQSKAFLKLVALPLSWAIRSELLINNLAQPTLFIDQLIKEKGFQDIILANSKGEIIIATNKKYEKKLLNEFFPFDYYTIKETAVVDIKKNEIFMAITPIYGLNELIGIVIITYKPDKINI